MDSYYTVEEVAKILKVSKVSVYRWIKDGVIQAEKFGHLVRIPATEIPSYRREDESK